PAASARVWERVVGGPTSVASCAATIAAAASFASCCSPRFLTSAAMTPAQPDAATSGAAIAPFDTASALTVWSSAVLNAAAVTFPAARGAGPCRVPRCRGSAGATLGLRARAPGRAVRGTLPLASGRPAASGIVLWVAAPAGRELNPIVAHGYTQQL